MTDDVLSRLGEIEAAYRSLMAERDQLIEELRVLAIQSIGLHATCEALLKALGGCRRSDGHGAYIACWCDSECGPVVKKHAPYCLVARAALALKEAK